MKANEHVHTPNDGRGWRDVFLDGKQIENVVYADTKEGFVRVVKRPIRLNSDGEGVVTKTLRGTVEVKPKGVTP